MPAQVSIYLYFNNSEPEDLENADVRLRIMELLRADGFRVEGDDVEIDVWDPNG